MVIVDDPHPAALPLGLARLGARAPDLIPWAWAVNGCASVVGAPLATLFAVAFGFTLLLLAAAGLYLAAAAAFPGAARRP